MTTWAGQCPAANLILNSLTRVPSLKSPGLIQESHHHELRLPFASTQRRLELLLARPFAAFAQLWRLVMTNTSPKPYNDIKRQLGPTP